MLCFLGWGDVDQEYTSAKELKEMSVKIINSPSCSCIKICVESPKKKIGHNICYGDSGGPLICQVPGKYEWELQGITSGAINGVEKDKDICEPHIQTAVYTSVYPLRNWINSLGNSYYEKRDSR